MIEPVQPRVSVVIPVYNEDEAIVGCLDRIVAGVKLPCEVLVVFDDDADSTVEPLRKYAEVDPRVVPTRNTYGPGPARVIRYGIDHVRAPVVVVTMADGSDDAERIDELCKLVERGVVVAAASRYMSGGQFAVPVTVRVVCGGGGRFGTQHSATGESWYMAQPGLRVVTALRPGL